MEELFRKAVPTRVKSNDRDEREVVICVTVLLNTVSSPVHKKELLVRLTDGVDPFFLYTLTLSEEDFQGLKLQQGLLVDFSAFPQKLIDLLEVCLAETSKDTPKFLLQFCESGNPSAPSLLHVVETNPFRHLNHLSLKFVPANDVYLKKYLAECLLQFKEENAKLSSHYASTKSDLSARLAQCEEALSKRTQELEHLKSEWSGHSASLASQHSASLNTERERALQAQAQAQAKFEQERRELEQTHQDRLGKVEGRLLELDKCNKELTDHKFRSEAALRELQAKLKSTEEECVGMREELLKLRKENAALDSSSHDQEKALTQLRTQVAVLQQELHDKEQVIGRTNELLESAQEQRRAHEAGISQRERQITKLDTAYKAASKEVLKGNEIIQKLQAEIRNAKSKLKVRNVVTTKQESLLVEKEKALGALGQEVSALKHSLTLKQEELSKSEGLVEELKGKLDQATEQLKTNENVITWLNKQVTEQVVIGRGPGTRLPGTSVPLPPGASGVAAGDTLRPPFSSSSLLSHYTAPSYPSLSRSLPGGKPEFSSTPVDSSTGGGHRALSNAQLPSQTSLPTQQHRNVLGPLSSKENIFGKQQVLFKGGKKTTPSPRSEDVQGGKKTTPSPLSQHAHTAKTTGSGTSSTDIGNVKTSPVAGDKEPWLDPKYLPPNTTTATETAQGLIRPTPSHPPVLGVQRAGSKTVVGGTGARFSGNAAVSGKLKPASLASSYFPKS